MDEYVYMYDAGYSVCRGEMKLFQIGLRSVRGDQQLALDKVNCLSQTETVTNTAMKIYQLIATLLLSFKNFSVREAAAN